MTRDEVRKKKSGAKIVRRFFFETPGVWGHQLFLSPGHSIEAMGLRWMAPWR